jgi:hypothetical protein
MAFPAVGVYAVSTSSIPAQAWWLYRHGHVIAATIIDSPNIEAQILLDGQLLYRSRHGSMMAAEEEIVELRRRWVKRGWVEPA